MRSSLLFYALSNKKRAYARRNVTLQTRREKPASPVSPKSGTCLQAEGSSYSDSYLSAKPLKGAEHIVHTAPAGSKNRYAEQKSTATGKPTDPGSAPASSKTRLSLYPIGHPDAKKIHTIDISEENSYNGKNHERIQEFRRAGSHPHRNTLHGTCNPPLFRRTLRQFHATGQNSGKLRPARRRTGRAGLQLSESYFPSSGYDIDAPDAPDGP